MCSVLSGDEGWGRLLGARWRCIGRMGGWEWSKVSSSSMLSSFFLEWSIISDDWGWVVLDEDRVLQVSSHLSKIAI